MSDAVPSTTFTGPLVDAEHPWLGLHPFTEENQHYFFGRTAEIRDIFLRVREQPLTVLYGQSGLGKTSLLRAGLIPKLRVERYRPVRILLDFDAAAPPLIAQVRAALAGRLCGRGGGRRRAARALAAARQLVGNLCPRETAAPGILPSIRRCSSSISSRKSSPWAKRVLSRAPRTTRAAEIAELIAQLADVIEGRAPAALAPGFGRDPQRALAYDFGPTAARLVVSLREDYLAQLEQWKGIFPSLMRNRMPLRLLSGPQALEAVVRPGGMGARPLVSEEVGAHIVRFVAQRPEATPLEEIEAVPPLVSLLCERLNDARLAAETPLPEITRALVEAQGADILQRFYDESFAAFPAVPSAKPCASMSRTAWSPLAAIAIRWPAKMPAPNSQLPAWPILMPLSMRWSRGGCSPPSSVAASSALRSRTMCSPRSSSEPGRNGRSAALSRSPTASDASVRRVRRIAAAFAVLGLLALCALVFAIFGTKTGSYSAL